MYLSITENRYEFKHPNIHTILDKDILISDEIYAKFFELQSQGKQFRIKDTKGSTFEEIFEEFIPNPVPQPAQPTVQDLQKQIFDLTTQLVNGGIL